jgi:hypothetical protein
MADRWSAALKRPGTITELVPEAVLTLADGNLPGNP